MPDNIPECKILKTNYIRVRQFTEQFCTPLATDDYQVQSIVQTSPPKWHIAHVTWFFETFVLSEFDPGYRPFNADFDYLFNSYYYTHGRMHPRPERGLLSRPTVEDVFEYRAYVDAAMVDLLDSVSGNELTELALRVTLGLHHEQQHQELLLMDVKHNFFMNPTLPAYRTDLLPPTGDARHANWVELEGGIHETGHDGNGFAFDNETPRHDVLLQPCRLADRFVTNGEYLAFMEDGAYTNPALWLADGWALIQEQGWQYPLYWLADGQDWQQFTLGGLRPLNPDEPVCHISFYEADAYARWAGMRLPLEAELEVMLSRQALTGNFVEDDLLHPAPADEQGQWYGDVWSWTASPYSPYPGYKPLAGAIGEYNGKFMSSQMVLKGGSCITSRDHTRPSYRNFFYPAERWACTGLRLAGDMG